MFNKKTSNVTFLAKINLSIRPNKYDFFSDFYLICEYFVFANYFERLPRNFLSVVRNIFTKTYPNFVTFDSFSKKKIENYKKSEKIRMHSDKLANQFWLKISWVTSFFVEHFFFIVVEYCI